MFFVVGFCVQNPVRLVPVRAGLQKESDHPVVPVRGRGKKRGGAVVRRLVLVRAGLQKASDPTLAPLVAENFRGSSAPLPLMEPSTSRSTSVLTPSP